LIKLVVYSLNSIYKKKQLLEQRDALIKKVGKEIHWDYYEEKLTNTKLIKEARSIFDSIFDESIDINKLAPEIVPFKMPEEVVPPAVVELTENIRKRVKELEDVIENEINPLLNPFSDFWLYERDGPEFSEIFAARPQWNEYINRAVSDYAFQITNNDPTLKPEIAEAYEAAIQAKLDEFDTGLGSKGVKAIAAKGNSSDGLKAIADVVNGKLGQQMLDFYETEYNARNEQALLEEYTYGDNASIAMRNAFVSGESDPQAKHFGGH